jgi:hypothetical protein
LAGLFSVKEHQSKHSIGRGEAKPNRDGQCSINRCLSRFTALTTIYEGGLFHHSGRRKRHDR